MALVLGHALQHQRAGFGEIDFIDRPMYRAFKQVFDACVVCQLQKSAHDLHQVLADTTGVIRLAEPDTNHLRWLMTVNECHQRLGVEKFFLHELAEVVANAIFIAWDNGRVAGDKRNRDTAKERHHGEPVCQRADHCRLGNRLHPADPEVGWQKKGNDEDRSRDQQ